MWERLTPWGPIPCASYASAVALSADLPALLDSVVMLEPGNTLGSAFIISSDGYVLTAAHVVTGLKTVPARLGNGVVLEAAVLRVEEGTDVALLKLPGTSYKPLVLSPEAAPGTKPDGLLCRVREIAAGGVGEASAGGDAVGERDAIAHMAADEEPGMLRFRLGHGVKEALVP